MRMSAAGTVTIPFTGTDAVLFHAREYNSAGSFAYSPDGAPPVTVTFATSTDSIALSGRHVNLTGLTAGAHTLIVTWVSGIVHLHWLLVLDGDYSKGVHVMEARHSGFAATVDFAQNISRHGDTRSVGPGLVRLELGLNGQRARMVSVAIFGASLLTLISQFRQYVTGRYAIGLVANFQSAGSYAAPWSAYIEGMREVEDASAGVGVIDLSPRMEATTADNADGTYQPDSLHPTHEGMDYIGNVVAPAIIPKQ
ncbi:hypothetical protein ACNI3K_00905 [Demequina sp. SO4-13]|uniref:hypothetical protein n=1 Tax=Demequina sp. SO4-13 TaxID=3401027 RepID=UPI003AF531C7